VAGGQYRCLVDHVFDVGSHKAWRGLCQRFQVYVVAQGFPTHVDLKDSLAPFDVGPVEHDAPVKAARAKQGRVQNIRAVRGCHNDHVGVSVESVHLDQNLV